RSGVGGGVDGAGAVEQNRPRDLLPFSGGSHGAGLLTQPRPPLIPPPPRGGPAGAAPVPAPCPPPPAPAWDNFLRIFTWQKKRHHAAAPAGPRPPPGAPKRARRVLVRVAAGAFTPQVLGVTPGRVSGTPCFPNRHACQPRAVQRVRRPALVVVAPVGPLQPLA